MRKFFVVAVILMITVGLLTGCAANKNVVRNNTLVADISKSHDCCPKIKDWNRIAAMSNDEICKLLGCVATERIVTKEVIKEVPVEKIVTREVIKEVPVEKIVEKIVEKETQKHFFVLPGVLFDTDKATLRPEGKKELDRAAKDLQANNYPAVVINGHTDSRASEKYNLKLSEARAKSVMEYLVGKGIPKDKMSAKGFGKTKPVAPNNTKEGMQKNRRVEIDLVNP